MGGVERLTLVEMVVRLKKQADMFGIDEIDRRGVVRLADALTEIDRRLTALERTAERDRELNAGDDW